MSQTDALWVMDVQERLFSKCADHLSVLQNLMLAVQGASILELPLFVTEQYPEGLGATISEVQEKLAPNQNIYSKTTFSGYSDPDIRAHCDELEVRNWVFVGIETHICVQQTALDLLQAGQGVIILKDATSSRSTLACHTALQLMRHKGATVTSTEAYFYDLLHDAKHPKFPLFLDLIKQQHV